jgi:calcineurin-like phosphoesterase family protein
MNDLVYLTNILKNRKYSIDKINKITNKLNQKVYYQMGGNPDINLTPLVEGYKNIIDKFKILNDSEFSKLI